MARLTLVLALLIAFLAGILFQRFLPVGSLLERLGWRDRLPVERNVPAGESVTDLPDWDVSPTLRGRLMLFVLIGQSNMSGRGRTEDAQTPAPHPRVFSFDKDFRWHPAREPLGTTVHDVDWVAIDGGTGVGPALAFARALLEVAPNLSIGLVPCARGASTIAEWQRDLSQNSLYGACLKRVRAAATYGEVAGVLMAQGESDADDPTVVAGRLLSAESWADHFTWMVVALRQDLNLPDLPVLYTQLGHLPAGVSLPGWETVRQQQAQIILPNVIMVPTADLPLQTDFHFATPAQVAIGQRLAQVYLDNFFKTSQ